MGCNIIQFNNWVDHPQSFNEKTLKSLQDAGMSYELREFSFHCAGQTLITASPAIQTRTKPWELLLLALDILEMSRDWNNQICPKRILDNSISKYKELRDTITACPDLDCVIQATEMEPYKAAYSIGSRLVQDKTFTRLNQSERENMLILALTDILADSAKVDLGDSFKHRKL